MSINFPSNSALNRFSFELTLEKAKQNAESKLEKLNEKLAYLSEVATIFNLPKAPLLEVSKLQEHDFCSKKIENGIEIAQRTITILHNERKKINNEMTIIEKKIFLLFSTTIEDLLEQKILHKKANELISKLNFITQQMKPFYETIQFLNEIEFEYC